MKTREDQQRLHRILIGQHVFMDQVHELLAEEQKHDDILKAVVLSSRKQHIATIERLDPMRVFHVSTIKALCIKYRLRFLDSGLFKGDIPPQAIHAIRQVERNATEPLRSFKIMAPAVRFKLCDSEVDPLLFVPIGNDNYYLVHKWGNDLKWHRVLRGWAFRTPLHLLTFVLAAAALIALIFPGELLEHLNVQRGSLFVWCSMVIASFTVFGWFAFFGQFSNESWNSRYFN